MEQFTAWWRGRVALPTAAHQQNRQPAAAQAGISTAEARRLLQQLAADIGVNRARPAPAPAGIDMAEARAWLVQLAADMEALRAGAPAAHQPRAADPAAALRPQAADLAVAPRPEPAAPALPADNGPLAAARELLLAMVPHVQRYAAVCAALGRAALGMHRDFVIGWSRAAVSEAALEVRGRCCGRTTCRAQAFMTCAALQGATDRDICMHVAVSFAVRGSVAQAQQIMLHQHQGAWQRAAACRPCSRQGRATGNVSCRS